MDKNTLNAYTNLATLLDKILRRYHNINTCQY
jgi:hypothetical protein